MFGSEFIAMKHAMGCNLGLRCKLRMMGASLSEPTYVYGDNMPVINNTQRPESMRKKKNLSLCYHACRESVTMGETVTGHIKTTEKVADIVTKILSAGKKKDYLVSKLLYDITGYMHSPRFPIRRFL